MKTFTRHNATVTPFKPEDPSPAFSAFLFDLGADVGRAQVAEIVTDKEDARRRSAAESDEIRSEGRPHGNKPQKRKRRSRLDAVL